MSARERDHFIDQSHLNSLPFADLFILLNEINDFCYFTRTVAIARWSLVSSDLQYLESSGYIFVSFE